LKIRPCHLPRGFFEARNLTGASVIAAHTLQIPNAISNEASAQRGIFTSAFHALSFTGEAQCRDDPTYLGSF